MSNSEKLPNHKSNASLVLEKFISSMDNSEMLASMLTVRNIYTHNNGIPRDVVNDKMVEEIDDKIAKKSGDAFPPLSHIADLLILGEIDEGGVMAVDPADVKSLSINKLGF